jgi:hypothetical protein
MRAGVLRTLLLLAFSLLAFGCRPDATVTITIKGASGEVVRMEGSVTCAGPGVCSHQVRYGAPVRLSAVPSPGSRFIEWSGACSGSEACDFVAERHNPVEARFEPVATSPRLRVTFVGDGKGRVFVGDADHCDESCELALEGDAPVAVHAAPDAWSSFEGFLDACTGRSGCFIAPSSDVTEVIADFRRHPQTTLSVVKTGSGSGTVASSDGRVDCGERCEVLVPADFPVTLVAKPGADALFVGWSAPCGADLECHLPISGPTAVQAEFVRAHPVHLVRMGDGSGEVVSADGSFRCGEQCEGLYPEGAKLHLTAVPDEASSFRDFSGACGSHQDNCEFTVTGPSTVAVRFVASHVLSKGFSSAAVLGANLVIKDAKMDSQGHIVAVGHFDATADFGGSTLVASGHYPPNVHQPQPDAFVAKYDGAGQLLWAQQFGDEQLQMAESVAIDSQDNIIVAFLNDGIIDPGKGPIAHQSVGLGPFEVSVVLAKFNPAGAVLEQLGSDTGHKFLYPRLAVGPADEIILYGWDVAGTVSFGQVSFTVTPTSNLYGGGVLFRLDTGLVPQWGKAIQAPGGFASVKVTSQGQIIVGGGGYSMDLGCGALPYQPPPSGYHMGNIFLASISPAGSCRWHRWIVEPSSEGRAQHVALAMDDDDRPFACLIYREGEVQIGNQVHPPSSFAAHAHQTAVIGFEGDSGGAIWSKHLKTAGIQYLGGATIDATGALVCGGVFSNHSALQIQDAVHQPLGVATLFLARFSPEDGTRLTSRTYPGDVPVMMSLSRGPGDSVLTTVRHEGFVDFGGGALHHTGGGNFSGTFAIVRP